MDKTMSEPLEKRVQAIELRIQFLESWKNTPYIQITIPLIISLFLATSWVNFALAQIDKRMDSFDKRLDKLEARIDRMETKVDRMETKVDRIELRMNRLESKMDLVISELKTLKRT